MSLTDNPIIEVFCLTAQRNAYKYHELAMHQLFSITNPSTTKFQAAMFIRAATVNQLESAMHYQAARLLLGIED